MSCVTLRFVRPMTLWMLATSALGCPRSGEGRMDAPMDTFPDSPSCGELDAPVLCGSVVCGPGQRCCDPRCGACVGDGGTCPRCPDAGPATACASNDDCGPSSYCRFEEGRCDGPGRCAFRGSNGGPPVDIPVCGCDGQLYLNDGYARASGTSSVPRGACREPADCRPQMASGDGTCTTTLGYAFDGSACVPVVGCRCIGESCDGLRDEAGCNAAYAMCPCRAARAVGEGSCDRAFGFAWNGSACVEVTGCTCVGPDCAGLPADADACRASHATCRGFFECAFRTMCARGLEICHVWALGGSSGACAPLPTDEACRTCPSCGACGFGDDCSDEAGALTTFVGAP